MLFFHYTRKSYDSIIQTKDYKTHRDSTQTISKYCVFFRESIRIHRTRVR